MSASKPLVALLDSLLLGQQAHYGLFAPSALKANAKMVKVSEHPIENQIKEVTWAAVPGWESLQRQKCVEIKYDNKPRKHLYSIGKILDGLRGFQAEFTTQQNQWN